MARLGAAWAGLALAIAASAPARAQNLFSEMFSRDTLHGMAEARLGAADGERSWLDGGFGKSGVSGGRDDWRVKPELSQAVVEWRPRLNFAVSAVVSGQLQPQVRPALDLDEAYFKLQAPPISAGRFSGRIGLFYPPVSLEHEGVGWTTPDTLSASAVNSWIGEEVKVLAAEATAARAFGDHEVAATVAVFADDDTAGTLLSFRGWALHGVRSGARTRFPLPPLSPFMRTKQAPETWPYRELDGRPGYYGRLEWRPPGPVALDALYYDNGGSRIGVDSEHQWAWETRFLDLGLRWDVDDHTRVLAQAMNGETLMGYRMPGGIWLDMGFRAGFVAVQRRLGEDALTARLDLFNTRDRTFQALDDNNERGWGLTGAWRHRLTPNLDLLVEAQHVASRRPARALAGDAARQGQTVLQSALRVRF